MKILIASAFLLFTLTSCNEQQGRGGNDDMNDNMNQNDARGNEATGNDAAVSTFGDTNSTLPDTSARRMNDNY